MNYYNNIKDLLINNELIKKAKDYSKCKSDLTTYYEVGKLLSVAGKHYGEGIIKEYSIKLTNELGKGYSQRSLKYMRKFYLLQKGQPLAAQLSWSHYIELLSLKSIEEINYYINVCEKYNLSRNNLGIENITEKMLQKLILENLNNFLEELGEGYSYIKNEYKIKIGDSFNYIDLLLYNIKYNCYVVVELKVTPLKKEHIGQISVYMNYIDKNIKTVSQNSTIGILIVKENNKFIIKYKTSDKIISREYSLI